jgi:hypothetical protein
VTCYWIDEELNYQVALLDFVELVGTHEGEKLAPVILKVLEDFGIENKLFCLTTDSAGNNGTMARALSCLLRNRGIIWDYEQRHIPCLTHVIHNNVNALMKGIKGAAADNDDALDDSGDDTVAPDLSALDDSGLVFSDILNKVRALAKKIRTPYGWEQFQDICKSVSIKPLKILLDTATRWNSTHRMLERILYLREAVRRFAVIRDDCIDLTITDSEWNLLELICGFLWPFRWATEALESSEKPELDRVFWIYNQLFSQIEAFQKTLEARQEMEEAWAAELLHALEKMYKHLQKYYKKATQAVYSNAVILHPRIKLKLFKTKDWGEDDANNYAQLCRDIYDDNYATEATEESENGTPYTGLSQKRKANQIDDEYNNYLDEQLANTRSSHELDMYLLEPTVPVKSALDYWQADQRKYPHLTMMARDVLAVPPSASGVEREFSIAGRIASWQRNRLHSVTITAIMVYKNHLRRCRPELKAEIKDATELGTEDDVDGETPEEEEEATKTIEEWRKEWRSRLDGVRGTRRF